MGLIWTKQEEEILKTLFESYKSTQEMHKVLPYRTIDSISGKLNKMGLSMNERSRPIDMDMYRRLMNEEPETI